MRRTLPRGLRACSVPAMDLDLVGRRAAVMASSDGIGKAIACALAREGVHVMMSGRDADKLAGAVEEAKAAAGHGRAGRRRERRPRHGRRPRRRSSRRRRGLRRPRHPRSPTRAGRPPARCSPSTTRPGSAPSSRCCCRSPAAPAPRCRTSRPPSRGASSRSPRPRSRPRCPRSASPTSSGPGIHGLVKTLAEELGPKGITVNLIAPGKIDTARVRWLDDTRAERSGSTARRGARGLRARRPARPLRRADRAGRGRSLPLLQGRALRLGHGHARRRRPRAGALSAGRAARPRPAADRRAAHDVVGARGADRARVGGLRAQRRSARARPDRPGRVRAGAALRAARRARRRPPRPAPRDGLRPRRDRARDGGHRASTPPRATPACGRSMRSRSSSASASRTPRRPTARCSRPPSRPRSCRA